MIPSPECAVCGEREARYPRPYAGDHVCGRCLVETVVDRAYREIRRWRWIRPRTTVAVALSGGKDSALALHVITRYTEPLPDVEIVAITVDEGIPGFRDRCVEKARELAERLGVRHEIVTFREEYGFDLEDVLDESPVPACTLCGVLRRRLLNLKARELNADVLVTGHNLDDEAQAVLMNVVKSDVDQLARLHPEVRPEDPAVIPRAKPLRRVPEREILWAATELDLPFHPDPCPHSTSSVRSHYRRLLDELEERIPDAKFGLLRFLDKTGPTLAREHSRGKPRRCEKCGEPASGELCKACQLLQTLGKDP